MEANDAASEFGTLYATVYDYCHRRLSPRAPRITMESLAFLNHLRQSGPLTIKEAAAHFDRSQAATSEMVQRLIQRGLIDRIEDERDRRRHLIWLTEPALEVVSQSGRPIGRRVGGTGRRVFLGGCGGAGEHTYQRYGAEQTNSSSYP